MVYCRNCGIPFGQGDKFCPACGSSMASGTSTCPGCGTPLPSVACVQRSKTAAVLLAVFLTFWTWLYTHDKDAWKFWTGVCLVLAATWVLVFTTGAWLVIGWSILAGLWVWSVLDVSVKDESWYQSF